MGGLPCITKKKICNPPAYAAMQAPEDVIAIYQSDPLYADKYDRAGFEAYIYRCAYLDDKTTTGYKQATDWFYQNVYNLEHNYPLLPVPWKTYVHNGQNEPKPLHDQREENLDNQWELLDYETKKQLLASLTNGSGG